MGVGHGRGTSGKRGIGSGSASHKTSTSKPAKPAAGIKKTGGDGMGGKAGKAEPKIGKKVGRGGKY